MRVKAGDKRKRDRETQKEGEKKRKRERWREREKRAASSYPFLLGSTGISQEFLARSILRGDGGAAVISYSPRRGMACTAIYFIMSLSLMALALTRL